MPGPPSTFTEERFALILDRLSHGEFLTVICRDIGVSRDTVREWCRQVPERHARFVQARDDGHDALADECVAIADDGSRDYKADEDGHLVADHDHIQRSKLRVDTRLRLLAKWASGKYGDKVQVEGKVTLESLVAAASAKPAE